MQNTFRIIKVIKSDNQRGKTRQTCSPYKTNSVIDLSNMGNTLKSSVVLFHIFIQAAGNTICLPERSRMRFAFSTIKFLSPFSILPHAVKKGAQCFNNG